MESPFLLPRGSGSITIKNGFYVVSSRGDLPVTQQIEHAEAFSYFNDFPIEIRLKIWRDSFTPRKVDLREGVEDPTSPFRFIDRPCRRARANLPPTAFVNRESREETLKHYCRLIQPLQLPPQSFVPAILEMLKSLCQVPRLLQISNQSISNHNVIYWHPKIDSVFICTQALWPSYDPTIDKYLHDMFPGAQGSYDCIDNIKEIEVYLTRDSDNYNFSRRSLKSLASFRCLEGLTLVNGLTGAQEQALYPHTSTPGETHLLSRINLINKNMDVNQKALLRFTVRKDVCIKYYKMKNKQERARFNQRPFGLVPVLGWIGWYVYYNRHYLKQAARYLFSW